MKTISIMKTTLMSVVMLASCGIPTTSQQDYFPTSVRPVQSREDLQDLLDEGMNRQGFEFTDVATPGVAEDASSNTSTNSNRFVDTNVQVEGIQEGDIVKTDGNFIYYASPWQSTVRVLAVSSQDVVSEVTTISLESENERIYTESMYLTDEYLVIIGYRFDLTSYVGCVGEDEAGNEVYCDYFPFWQPTGSVVLINRDTYQIEYTLRTDAAFMDHRIVPQRNQDGTIIAQTLFLVGHNYFYYTYQEDETELRPYFIENEGEKTYLDYNEMFYFENSFVYGMTTLVAIPILSSPDSITYNASAYLGSIADYKKVYVDFDSLYLAQSNYHWNDNQSYQTTTLSKYTLNVSEATIEFKAVVTLLGTAINQFALDEYDGYFRIATTNEVYTYTGGDVWIWSNENRTITNRLYILEDDGEGSFSTVSVLEEGLGKPGERIYSVRFEGPIAYIVTFERIDPLYIIDLSDPLNPSFRSEIVLPGFDTYQHPWSDSHLIGIGYNIDETTGWMSGMKMTAYDVGDNAREIQTINISSFVTKSLPRDLDSTWSWAYSEALYNHKAIVVSEEENVFAFSVNTWAGGYRQVNNTSTDPDAGGDEEPQDDTFEYFYEYHSLYVIFRFDFTQEEPILEPHIIEHPTSEIDFVQIDRGVMINDVIHTISNRQLVSYSLTQQAIIQTLVYQD